MAHHTICILKNKFTSQKLYSFGRIFSGNPMKSHTDQVYYFPLTVWKETIHKPSKVATAKNVLSSVFVIVTPGFDVFYYMWQLKKHCFLKKSVNTLTSFQSPRSCTLWNKLFERGPHFNFYLHNKSAVLIPKRKYPKQSSTMKLPHIILADAPRLFFMNEVLLKTQILSGRLFSFNTSFFLFLREVYIIK